MTEGRDLKLLDELARDVTLLVEPVKVMTVTDFKSAEQAIETAQQIKSWITRVEKARNEYLAPLRIETRRVNDKAEALERPLRIAEVHLKSQLVEFDLVQEKIRREEGLKAAAEAAAKAEALMRAHEAERQETEQALAAFGGEEAEHQAMEEKQVAEQAQLSNEISERAWNIKKQGVSGMRKTWEVKVVDLDLVPKDYLIREINRAAVLALKRAQPTLEIPGLEFSQVNSLPIGRNTRVPRS